MAATWGYYTVENVENVYWKINPKLREVENPTVPTSMPCREVGGESSWTPLRSTSCNITPYCSFPGDLQEDAAALPSSVLLPTRVQRQHKRLRHDGVVPAKQQLSANGFLPCRHFPGGPWQPRCSSPHQCPLRASL